MTEIQVEKIVEELTREQSRLRDRLTTLKAELSEIDSALARVNGALNALRGSSKKRTTKPAASKQEVIELITSVLREQDTLSREALKLEVEKRLLASGKSRMGFALRFKEALAEKHIIETLTGFSLTENLSPKRLSA